MGEAPETQRAGDTAFQVLLDAVSLIVGESASVDDIRVHATAMWSAAHGLATLLIDGPLELKIGTVDDRRALVQAVARRLAVGVGRINVIH
jgi:hypothetical protein